MSSFRNAIILSLLYLAGQIGAEIIGDTDLSENTICTPCPVGYAVSFPCTSASDTECVPCPQGTYNNYAAIDALCMPCSACKTGTYQSAPCDSTHDTVCHDCSVVTDYSNPDYMRKCEEDTQWNSSDDENEISNTELDSHESLATDYLPVSDTPENNNDKATNVPSSPIEEEEEADGSGEGSGEIFVFEQEEIYSTVRHDDKVTTAETQVESDDIITTQSAPVIIQDTDDEDKATTAKTPVESDDDMMTESVPIIIQDTDDHHMTTEGEDVILDIGRKQPHKHTTTESHMEGHHEESDDVTTAVVAGIEPEASISTIAAMVPVEPIDKEEIDKIWPEMTDAKHDMETSTESDLFGGFVPIRKEDDGVLFRKPVEAKDDIELTSAADLAVSAVEETKTGKFMWPGIAIGIVVAMVLFILIVIVCVRRKNRQQMLEFKKERPLEFDDIDVKRIDNNHAKPLTNGQRTPIYTGNRHQPDTPKYSLVNGSGKDSPANLTPSKKRRPFGASIEFDFMDDASENELEKRPPSAFNEDCKSPNTQSLRNLLNRFLSVPDVQKEAEEGKAGDDKDEEKQPLNGDAEFVHNGKPRSESADYVINV